MKNTIFGTDLPTLVFEDRKLYNRFKKEKQDLYWKFYGLIIAESGIWASNQDKFVSSPTELNDWEDDTYREYLVWLENETKMRM